MQLFIYIEKKQKTGKSWVYTSGDVLLCFTPAGKGALATSLEGATFLVVASAAAASVSLASPSLGQALGAGRGGSSHPACVFACAGTTCTSLLKQAFYIYIHRYTCGHHHLPKPQAFYAYNMLKYTSKTSLPGGLQASRLCESSCMAL